LGSVLSVAATVESNGATFLVEPIERLRIRRIRLTLVKASDQNLTLRFQNFDRVATAFDATASIFIEVKANTKKVVSVVAITKARA
jgi:hypothetical protein